MRIAPNRCVHMKHDLHTGNYWDAKRVMYMIHLDKPGIGLTHVTISSIVGAVIDYFVSLFYRQPARPRRLRGAEAAWEGAGTANLRIGLDPEHREGVGAMMHVSVKRERMMA